MKLEETFKEFFKKNNGKFVEVSDSSNLNQCMDLAFAWCDTLSIPQSAIRHLYAYQVFSTPTDETLRYFDYIPNTPNGIPQVGDLVVFSNKLGIAGHIDIATGVGSVSQFTGFDQNWGADKHCHEVIHPYDAVLGFLRPKIAVTPSIDITDQTLLDTPSDGLIQVGVVKSLLSDRKRDLIAVQGKVDDYLKTIGDLDKTVQQLKASTGSQVIVQEHIEYQPEVSKVPNFIRRVFGDKV